MMSATALQVAGGGLRASAERVHVRGFGAIDVYAPVSAAASLESLRARLQAHRSALAPLAQRL
jgi:hypothetical protein